MPYPLVCNNRRLRLILILAVGREKPMYQNNAPFPEPPFVVLICLLTKLIHSEQERPHTITFCHAGYLTI